MMVNAIRHGFTRAALPCAAAVLVACGGEGSGVPPATMLSPVGANDQYASFSPDGSHVAYWAIAPNGWRLTVAAADLSGQRTLDSSAVQFNNAPLWSPDGSSLAYMAGPNIDIWLVSASGGAPRHLTESKGIEIPVQWHPQGGRLAYIATFGGGEVHSGQIAIATGKATPILPEDPPAAAFWSPDGSKIAYNVFSGGQSTIWVADSTGQNGRQLTTEGFESVALQPWSPDGSELLYVSRRTGTADIWIVPINGDSARQLTRDVLNDTDPHWSADGQWVAFVSNRGRQTDVWIVPAAGGTPERVTDDSAPEENVQWVGSSPEVAFTTGVTLRGLWVRSLADTSERRLTPDSIRVGAYDLSPDGSEVVYQVVRGGGVSDLVAVPVTGGASRTLVEGTGGIDALDWSPDGSKVLYVSDKTGNDDVWVVDSAGGTPRDLVAWPTNEQSAAWSRDGASIYFTSERDADPISDLWTVPASGGEPQRVTRIGTAIGVFTSRKTPDVFVLTFGGTEGQVVLSRLLPDGKLQAVWDRSSVLGTGPNSIAPSGDSIALGLQRQGGGLGMMLVPTHGGQGRPFLGNNEGVMDWSSDGTKLIYFSGVPNSDLYVMSLQDSSTQQLTNTPDDEGGARWLAGGQSILFYRSTTHRRIATVDVGHLMAAER